MSYTVVDEIPTAAHGIVVSGALTYAALADPDPFNNLGAAITKVS